jgi:hypothetical protein
VFSATRASAAAAMSLRDETDILPCMAEPQGLGSGLPPTRERVTVVVVAIALFVVVGAFGWRVFSGLEDPVVSNHAPPPVAAAPVSLWLSAARVPTGPVELVALLVNDRTADVMFGVYAKVDRWNGDAWVPAGQLVMCMDHWHCTAQILPPVGSVAVPSIGLSPQPGVPGPVERFTTDGLQSGWYRISQVANEGITAAAVLEIADDAPAPAPLVPVDRSAISVSPALLSPTGGKVMLYPLISAGTGAQSRQDVEEAIRGLSETARIERWDGSSWTAVQNVDLEKTGNDDLVRSTTLPPLPLGVYRLLREGPEMPHAGSFWVSSPTDDSDSG